MKLHYTGGELLHALNKGENVLGLPWVCIDDLAFANKNKQCNRWYTMLLDSNGNMLAYLDFNFETFTTYTHHDTYGDILSEWHGLRIRYFKIVQEDEVSQEIERAYIHLRHFNAISKDTSTNSIQIDASMVLVEDAEPLETNVLVTLSLASRKITIIPN